MVMIEAMACGTPVIAFRRGSSPEVIDEGVSGFLVGDVDEAVAAAGRVAESDRLLIRRQFEQRFSIERVAREYVRVYRSLPGVRKLTRSQRQNSHFVDTIADSPLGTSIQRRINVSSNLPTTRAL